VPSAHLQKPETNRSVAPASSAYQRHWQSSGAPLFTSAPGPGESAMFPKETAQNGYQNLMRKQRSAKTSRHEEAVRMAKKQVLESQVELLQSDLKQAILRLGVARREYAQANNSSDGSYGKAVDVEVSMLDSIKEELHGARERVERFIGEEKRTNRVHFQEMQQHPGVGADADADADAVPGSHLEKELTDELTALRSQLSQVRAKSGEQDQQLDTANATLGDLSFLESHWRERLAEKREKQKKRRESVKERGTMWDRTQRYNQEKEQRIEELRRKQEELQEEVCTFRPEMGAMTIEMIVAKRQQELEEASGTSLSCSDVDSDDGRADSGM